MRRRSLYVLSLAAMCIVGLSVSDSFAATETDTASAQMASVRSEVTARLVSLGLSPEEAGARVNALTDADLQKLAENPEQLAMGGVKDRTLIIIALILILPSLILLLAL